MERAPNPLRLHRPGEWASMPQVRVPRAGAVDLPTQQLSDNRRPSLRRLQGDGSLQGGLRPPQEIAGGQSPPYMLVVRKTTIEQPRQQGRALVAWLCLSARCTRTVSRD